MAKLIKTDGSCTIIEPHNGTDFKLKELQQYLQGNIEIIRLKSNMIMVVNEEGKFSFGQNMVATILAHLDNAIFMNDYIAGDVILCKNEEVQ